MKDRQEKTLATDAQREQLVSARLKVSRHGNKTSLLKLSTF